MRATKQLEEAWGPSVKERNAAPAPQPSMDLTEALIVVWTVREEYECLGHRRSVVATRFEEYRMRSEGFRFLYDGHFFRSTASPVISSDRDETVYGLAFATLGQISQLFSSAAPRHSCYPKKCQFSWKCVIRRVAESPQLSNNHGDLRQPVNRCALSEWVSAAAHYWGATVER